MDKIIQAFSDHWHILIGALTATFGAGKLKAVLVTKSDLQKELYDPQTHKQLYMLADVCEEEQMSCKTNICKKIDEVKEEVKDMNETQVDFLADLNKYMLANAERNGRIDQFIDNHKTKKEGV